MNLKEIREVINLMNENGLAEVEIEREGSKIKLKKTVDVSTPVYQPPAAPVAVETKETASEIAKPANKYKEIKSPMVGTFYVAPDPDAEAFVKVGQVVEVGQVVGIVEAMKLMNEIKSEIKGKIIEAPIENAQPVEFGQALFIVEPI